MAQDYGPYGQGLDGYVHYMQAFNETQRGGGGGGRKPSSNSGCLTSIISIMGALLIVVAIIVGRSICKYIIVLPPELLAVREAVLLL